VIKVVMASVMLIVAVSRGAKIPGYLADVGLRAALDPQLASILDKVSNIALFAALGASGVIISAAMIKGMLAARAERQVSSAEEGVLHG
jgi:hypothetical protein